jgi:uncharacterized repeat protein (TIGR01451 family)
MRPNLSKRSKTRYHRKLFGLLLVMWASFGLWAGLTLLAHAAPDPAAPANRLTELNGSTLPIRPFASSDLPHPVPALAGATTCDTYYFHNQSINVGAGSDGGSRKIATMTAPSSGAPATEQRSLSVLGTDVEIIRFFSDPVLPLGYDITGDIVGLIWLQTTDFNNTIFTVEIWDYNPANGSTSDLGEIEFQVITDGQNQVELPITPPPGASIPAGHRFLLKLLARGPLLQSPTVTLFYDSLDRDSQFTVCHPSLPQLTISKQGPTAAVEGAPINYTLTVTNSGALAATNLIINDTIPAEATYISGGTKNGNSVTWSELSLAPGATIQRSFIVTASSGTITNDDYSVSADGNISAAGQEPVVTLVSPSGQPNLVITKDGPQSVTVGELITYTLTVFNGGDVTANTVIISDTIPAGAHYVSGADTFAGNVARWSVSSIAPNTEIEVQFSVTATETVTNDDYEAKASAYPSAIGQESVSTQVNPRQVFLPITFKATPTTLLRIQSENTGGISLVRVLKSDGTELLRCINIPNNATVTCGTFATTNPYRVTAQTNNCGLLQGTFNDSTAGGSVNRQIFCN